MARRAAIFLLRCCFILFIGVDLLAVLLAFTGRYPLSQLIPFWVLVSFWAWLSFRLMRKRMSS
jgi:hypothetical protein